MSNEQKIASFEDAKEAIAKAHRYPNWTTLAVRFWHNYDEVQYYINKASELYAESKARQAWDRACEAQMYLVKCAQENHTGIDREYYMSNAPKPDYKP